MTQYLLSVWMVEGTEPPAPEEMEQMYKDVDAFNDELKARGHWVFAGGLHPAGTATVVRAARAATWSPPTARSPRPRSSSAGSGSSTPPTSTPRWRWPPGPPGLQGAGRGAAVPGRAAGPEVTGPPDVGRSAAIFRAESGRAVATLVRLFGDIDIAEEAVQDAFAVAVERWPATGLPPNPGGWITTTARNRAIDRLRRESSRHDRHAQAALIQAAVDDDDPEPIEPAGPVSDDRLRLIFTCCHPALAPTAQVGLTLRLLGGLQTPEIARAFLVPEATMAAAPGPGQAQDRRGQDPLPGAGRRRAARPAPACARRRLPGLQRGLHGHRRRRPRPGRPLRRGDPPGPAAGRAHARRARGARAAGPAAADRVAPGRPHRPDGRLVLLPDQDRSRWDRR